MINGTLQIVTSFGSTSELGIRSTWLPANIEPIAEILNGLLLDRDKILDLALRVIRIDEKWGTKPHFVVVGRVLTLPLRFS